MSGIRPNLREFDPLASSSSPSPNGANPVVGWMHVQGSPSLPPISSEHVQFLKNEGFTMGMIKALNIQRQSFPLRVWILDNSSAMTAHDAKVLLRGNYGNMDNVSRWEELKDCVKFHANVAARLLLPTRFALLNAPQHGLPQYFSLAQGGNVGQEQQIIQSILTHVVPNGPSPLTEQLQILYSYIASIAPQLRTKHQTVPIVLTTQGLPTNAASETSSYVIQEFVQSLRSFETLPVSIVLRLCTDDEKVIDFYNSLDRQLKLDVLDDYYGEALEAYLRNPWLTYGVALHRYREMGFRVPVLDILDERSLTVHELRELCLFLFDESTLPDPGVDWDSFVQSIVRCMSWEQSQWNPIKKSLSSWIDIVQLNQVYSPGQSQRSQNHPTASFSNSSSTASPATPWSFQNATASTKTIPTPQTQPVLNTTDLVKAIEMNWAKLPPNFATTKPLVDLLSSVDVTFQLVDNHEHFSTKFHPFSAPALTSGGNDVVKRAVRKMRFFLHPDRLPKDFNEQQAVLCRTLWDTISDSWDSVGA
jgi:hypothetical protein